MTALYCGLWNWAVGWLVHRGSVHHSNSMPDIHSSSSSRICAVSNLVGHGSSRTVQALANCCILGSWCLVIHVCVLVSMDLYSCSPELDSSVDHRLVDLSSDTSRCIGMLCSGQRSRSRELSSCDEQRLCGLLHPDHLCSDLVVGSRDCAALV